MYKRGQVLLEYLILLGLVAFLALASFRPHGVIDETVNATKDYYRSGARAILGGFYNDNGNVIMQDPAPIDGGWCEFSACINGYRVRECACPRPAFGGREGVTVLGKNYCDGAAVWADPSCPKGEVMCPDKAKNQHYIIGQGCGCYDFERVYKDRCCAPDCAGKACGADDSCGGQCNSGICPTKQRCDKGVCVDVCQGVSLGLDALCGEYHNICPNTGCQDGLSCVAGQCKCKTGIASGEACNAQCPGPDNGCGAGLACMSGACQCRASGGLVDEACNTTCAVNCASGLQCDAGKCACPTGRDKGESCYAGGSECKNGGCLQDLACSSGGICECRSGRRDIGFSCSDKCSGDTGGCVAGALCVAGYCSNSSCTTAKDCSFWGPWSTWSACSVTSGTGEQTSTRTCQTSSSWLGAADCSGLDGGNAIKKQSCCVPVCAGACGGGSDGCGGVCASKCRAGQSCRNNECVQITSGYCVGNPWDTTINCTKIASNMGPFISCSSTSTANCAGTANSCSVEFKTDGWYCCANDGGDDAPPGVINWECVEKSPVFPEVFLPLQ
ncbi:MAG: thrombospondin type-1 domain-containing protein [Candidatus Omnitrophica bacterium]|nr:thrombospondin type-1 domain-containing protein [Candidatus Omnitrophota bacterium]